MATNAELMNQMAIDLGQIDLFSRRKPYAKEIFNYYDMDLLPHASTDCMLGEIYEKENGLFRTSQDNIIGYIAPPDKVATLKEQLETVNKFNANVPDFEFSKEEVKNFGFKLPFLFNLGFSGNISATKNLKVQLSGIKKSRLTNTDQPGIEINKLFSLFSQNESKVYRNKIKHNYIVEAFFYADSVTIDLEKDQGAEISLNFDKDALDVEIKGDTKTESTYLIKYKASHQAPFAATFRRGKEW